ncbi:MAG: endolytic transglycosylase MltG [Clostridiales bacterium]|nr:endolytic transglycosylase MltG [Clostridiales bacterium]
MEYGSGGNNRENPDFRRAWRRIRPLIVALLSVGICALILVGGVKFAYEKLFAPVDPSDATPITVTIKSNSGASAIAGVLYKAGGTDENGEQLPGLIASKTVFKIYADFTGKTSKLKAGTYVLSRNMSVGQILDIICEGNPPRTTMRFTTTEGITVEGIAEKLVSLGVLENEEQFLSLCTDGAAFDYSFLNAIEQNPKQARDYLLEGYLFPDTYEIYTDESAQSIITRLLVRFRNVFSDEYAARAQELGMTLDEVITLASLIEKEAKMEGDFAKVSAVFHNRLKEGMKLQSDAPLKYILDTTDKLTYTETEMQNDSLYNTHVHGGLPLGPICNPGERAIRAALYPNEEFLSEGYLYFCLMDPSTGANAYARTLEEHNENVALYRDSWNTTQ